MHFTFQVLLSPEMEEAMAYHRKEKSPAAARGGGGGGEGQRY
jgi:hypothetical protein